MSTKTSKILTIFTLALGLLAGRPLLATDSLQTAAFKKQLASVSPIELPAKAASLVSAASEKEKADATVIVVQAALGLNPAAAPAVVGEIAREVPAMAAGAAVAAAQKQPKRLTLIARAAAAGAPAAAGQITAQLIREFPSQYPAIAIAVSEGAPGAGKEILQVVSDYVPSLQASLQKDVSVYATAGGSLPVEAILHQSYQESRAATAAVPSPAPASVPPQASQPSATFIAQAPPTLGLPYTPLPVTPIEIGETNVSYEKPGGRKVGGP